MSVEAINWALNLRGLSASQKSVLFVLANRANDVGKCFPGQDNIGEQAGLSRRQVIRVISALKEAKVLDVVRRGKSDGGRASNLYQLHLSASPGISPDKGLSDNLSQGGYVTSEGGLSDIGVTGLSDMGVTGTQSIINPKKKPKRGFSLPDWVDTEAWQEFEQHRRELKKPLTDLARTKNLNVLSAHKGDQREIVNASIAAGWSGLFPPKKSSKANGAQSESQILASARAKGIEPRPGESWESVRQRVAQAH